MQARSEGKRARKSESRTIWAADCETDPAKYNRVPRPFVWGAYNGCEYRRFDTTEAFLAFMREQDAICFAHNGGKFDWHYLLPFLEPPCDVMVIAGRLAKFKVGKCEFRDSFNIMPMPLAAGGAKFEIDYSILERRNRDKPENREKIETRLRTDCLYLYAMLEKFVAEFGLHLTISTASMSAWSAISGTKKPKTSKAFYDVFAPYYFGGRVEVFEPGIQTIPFKIIDKNSAYPHAMLSLHPWGTTYDFSTVLPKSDAYVSRSFIMLTCRSMGAFPFRDPDGVSLTFPADNAIREFRVTGWEYLAARETGSLRDATLLSVVTLPESVEFNSYMDHFYRMKTDAKAAKDAARYEFSKRFLCSLYGKFGSNPDEYSEYRLCEQKHIEWFCEAEGFAFVCLLGDWALLQKPLPDYKQHYYNVATAASITGYVRADLWRSLRNVSRPIYCDTDSIACRDTGSLELDESKLGAWKVEAECTYGAFSGRKLYAVRTADNKWKTASKGVRLTHKQIMRIAAGETIEHKPEFPTYSVRKGITFQTRKIRATA